jgi:hypothetical protein
VQPCQGKCHVIDATTLGMLLLNQQCKCAGRLYDCCPYMPYLLYSHHILDFHLTLPADPKPVLPSANTHHVQGSGRRSLTK